MKLVGSSNFIQIFSFFLFSSFTPSPLIYANDINDIEVEKKQKRGLHYTQSQRAE